MSKGNINLGYACNRSYDINRTLRLETYKKKGIQYIRELARINVETLHSIIQWNIENDIHLFRISSELFPHITNNKLQCLSCSHDERPEGDPICSTIMYNISFLAKELSEIGKLANKGKIRLTFHAQPYVKLASLNPVVVQNSKADLIHTANIINYLGTKHPIIILHLGGRYGNLKETLKRFKRNFKSLPKNVQSLISLENTEDVTADELLPICEELGIPLTFDIFHHSIHPGTMIIPPFNRIKKTWGEHRLKCIYQNNVLVHELEPILIMLKLFQNQ